MRALQVYGITDRSHRSTPTSAWRSLVCLLLVVLFARSVASQDREELVRADVIGGLESLKIQITEYSNDPTTWGTEEQQYSTALEILRAIDTAHARGIGLLENQPLEAHISAVMTPEMRALIESMPRDTTHDMARKLTVALILGDSAGSIRRDLLDAQNENGSWGIEAGRAGNPVDTAVAITALLGIRPIQVPQEACLAAAEYLQSTMASGGNPDSAPLWPLSGEPYGESHLEYGAIGLKAIRLIESRVTNNDTRNLLRDATSYVAAGGADVSVETNSVEQNALALWSIHGLLLWSGSSLPVDAILDPGVKNVDDTPGQPRTVSWNNSAGKEDAYTTALAVNALAFWLPELEVEQPDLTSLAGDLILDTVTNEIKAVYRNEGESPAVAFPAADQNSFDPVEFVAGKARIELPTPSPADVLVMSTDYFNEMSALQSDTSQALGVVGPGHEPIPVTLLLDPDGVINETDESNNRVTLAIDRNDMGFDMSISETDITFEESSGTWTVSTTARAVGRDILLTDVILFSLESSTDDVIYTTVSPLTAIPSTSGRNASYVWTITAPAVDTYYRVTLSSVDECVTCDTNNSATALANVSAVNSGQNVQITSAANQTSSYQPGNDLDLLVTVDWANIDPQHTSTKLEFLSNGIQLTTVDRTIALSGSSPWSDTITIPGALLDSIPIRFDATGSPTRRLELTAVVDQLAVIPETNEFDNAAEVIVDLDFPDLVIDTEAISVSHLDLASDPETIVSVGIRNDGTAPLDLDAAGATLIFEYSEDGNSYSVFSSQSISGLLGYGEGQSYSAPLVAPVGTVYIRVAVTYDSAPTELSTANNSATTSFEFTRESLTIELRPETDPPSSSVYSANQSAVRNFGGVIADLYHQAPPQDPIDPTDGVIVTYEAFFGPVDATADSLYELDLTGGNGNSFKIPLSVFETWAAGSYQLIGYGYEDGRLASTARTTFSIAEYSNQRVAASVFPPDLLADQLAIDLNTNEPAGPIKLFVSSTTNLSSRELSYSIVLEKNNPDTGTYSELDGFSNSDPINIFTGTVTPVITAGSINRRLALLIPSPPGTPPPVTSFTTGLSPGLYRFWVEISESGSSTVLASDDAVFRVGQPKGYVIDDKSYSIDGEPISELRPIEGQEVDVTITIRRDDGN